MSKEFYFDHENAYDGPFSTLKEAKEASLKEAPPASRIKIFQVVEVSEVPTRTWDKA